MNDIDIARMIVGTFIDEEPEMKSEKSSNVMDKISKLESGAKDLSVIGRVMGISNPKKFVTRKGKAGKLCNIQLADDTAEARVVLWTENIKLLKNIKEGDVIQVNKVDVKDGYRSSLELHLQPRSTIEVLDSSDYPAFPEYQENITQISDIIPEESVNIVGRIVRITSTRTFDKNGKEGKVRSLELQDQSGKITYTLWNNDVELIEDLDLHEGDSIKILSAQARERDGDISISHWDGRIIKDNDLDLPEFEEKITKIAEASEIKDVTLMGIITKILDTITFQRQDGSTGYVKSIEIADDTGAIRVTLWGDDTNLDLNKGDIVKITGGNIEFDEYSTSGYKVNTTWNTRIIKNPDDGDPALINLLNEYQNQLAPVKIEHVQEFEEDGEEIDVFGRVMNITDPREFQREDGTQGIVRSADLADETGVVRVSFWDDKANSSILPGTPILIENARTRMGLYSVELNVGRTTRVIQKSEKEAEDLPSFSELEDMIYTSKKIAELDEDDRNIRLIARIFDLQDPVEFQRQDGNVGLVRTLDLGDDTGSIRASFWDDKAEIAYDLGDPLKIENPRVVFRNDQLELSIGNNTKVSKVGENELEDLPSFEELQDTVYVSKNIEDLEDDDRNVKITGRINEVNSDKLISPRCPGCNNRLEQVDGDYVCDYCGDDFDKPKYLLMIPARIEDDTGDIQITFFSKLAEELLGMTTDEVAEVFESSGDENPLAAKADDLEGLELIVVADVNFDDYNEEIRLNPKKIVSKNL
jgi:replication factor A1